MKLSDYRTKVSEHIRRASDMIVLGGYPIIASAVLLPILSEYASDPAGAFNTLTALLGGIGGNLIANIVQGVYEEAETGAGDYDLASLAHLIDDQIRTDAEINNAIAQLVLQSKAIREVYDELRGLPQQWNEFAEKLLEQVKDKQGTSVIIESLQVEKLAVIELKRELDTSDLVTEYLNVLAASTDRLRLGTIDPKFEIEVSIKLSEIYVEPRVSQRLDGVRTAITSQSSREPVEIISDALREQSISGLVILGGPGTGKSSLVDRLTNSLSLALLQSLQDIDGQKEERYQNLLLSGWTTALVIPVRVSLQHFAASHLPPDVKRGASGFVWDYITKHLKENALVDFAPFLNLLLSGKIDVSQRKRDSLGIGGLVLFDGLDEVPRHQRTIVEECLHEFSKRFKKSLVVITCRTYSWEQNDLGSQTEKTDRRFLSEYPIYEIDPFTEPQISKFIERWYKAIRVLKKLNEDTVKSRITGLKDATKLASLVPLAEKPLLLTLMATLHTSRGDLPNDRPTLYRDCVALLLEVWQRSKDLRIGGRTTVEGGLLEEFGIDSDTVERVLRKMAYNLHTIEKATIQPGRSQSPVISGDELRKEFLPLVANSWDQANALVSYVQRRAGLLEHIGDDAYRFPHRTFQEFLAACYLLDEPHAPTTIIEHFVSDPAWWGEVFSLAVGRQSRTAYSQAVHILYETAERLAASYIEDTGPYGTLLNTMRDINLDKRQDESTFYAQVLEELLIAFLTFEPQLLDNRVLVERGSIFGNSSGVLAPYVLKLLDSDDAGNAAANYIGAYGNTDLVPQLSRLLENEKPEIRARATHAVGGIGDPGPIDIIVRLSTEDEPDIVVEAMVALGRIGGKKAEFALIDAIKNSDIEEARRFAVLGLSQIGGSKAISELCDLIDYSEFYTVQNIIEAMSVNGSLEAIFCLIDLLRDSEYGSLAADGLIDIGHRALEHVQAFYEKTNDYYLMNHCRLIITSIDPAATVWKEDLWHG